MCWPSPASRLTRTIGARFSVSVKRLPSLGASLTFTNTETQHGRFASNAKRHVAPPVRASRSSASESFFKLTWLRIVVVRVVRSVVGSADSGGGWFANQIFMVGGDEVSAPTSGEFCFSRVRRVEHPRRAGAFFA